MQFSDLCTLGVDGNSSLAIFLPLVPTDCCSPTLEHLNGLQMPNRWCKKAMIRCEYAVSLSQIDREVDIIVAVQRITFQGSQY